MKSKLFESAMKSLRKPSKNFSPLTIKTYERTLVDFENFLEGRTPTIELAETYLATRKIQNATYNTYASGLRNFFKVLNIDDPENKLKLIAKKKVNNIRSDKFVTFKQVNEIVDIVDTLQEKVIVRLLYHGGMRPGSEFYSLNVGDIDLLSGKLKVKGSKSSKKIRVVTLIEPDYVIPLVKRYFKQRGINPENPSLEDKKQPLVVGRGNRKGKRMTWGGVRAFCLKIRRLYPEIPDLSPHWFRHGFAVWCKIDGMPVDLCAIQLGNTPQTCSEIYSHFSEQDVDRYFKEREKTKEESNEYVDPLSEVAILRDELKKMKQDLEVFREWKALKEKG